MPRPPSIDIEKGEELLRAYQRIGTVAGAARAVGVSESAARRYLDGTPEAAAPVVATQREIIETAGASLFNVTTALEENYRRVLRLVAKLEAGIVVISEGADGELYQTTVSPAVLVSALKEARGYIDSSARLLELMVSVNEVRRFQQAVLDVMASELDEATRQHIFDRLRRDLPLGLLPGGGR